MVFPLLRSLLAASVCLLLAVPGWGQAELAVGDSTQTFRFEGQRVPYRVFIPASSRPERGFPLLVALHGGGDDHNKYFEGYDNGALIRAASDRGMAILAPRTRPYGGYGEREQREIDGALRDVLARAMIDSRKIYLLGHSMGGSGALMYAARRPGRFAAVASFAGPTAYPVAPVLGTTPVYLAHGSKDEIIPVEKSRKLAETLRKAGVPVEYNEIAGADHNSRVAATFPAMLDWLLQLARP